MKNTLAKEGGSDTHMSLRALSQPQLGFDAAKDLSGFPLERKDFLEAVLTQLVERIAAELAIRQQGAIQLECRLGYQAGELSFVVGLFEASGNSRHLLDLLQMQLEQHPLTSPVVWIRLTVLLSARLVYRQITRTFACLATRSRWSTA